jgi:hypothetical protein
VSPVVIARCLAAALFAVPLLAVPLGAGTALAESKGKPTRAEIEAKLKRTFPAGHRAGWEGVMKLGGQFRTVSVRNWEQCRETCYRTPWAEGSGCLLWTFHKAADAKMPNTCRMWWELPEVRENPDAVSGAGKMK